MSSTVANGLDEIRALSGQHLGYSEWMTIEQERVNVFADATLDHQWIHCDPVRAAAESPFERAIAHGYLTLSLIPHLYHQALDVQGIKMAINYGLNRLRFPSPVKVGSRVRLGLELADVRDIDGGVQCTMNGLVEIDGQEKPAMVAELLYRYYG